MVKLTGIKDAEKKPVPEVVDAVKDLLAMAESGELRELAYCGITKTCRPVWDYMGEILDTNLMYVTITHLKNHYYEETVKEEE